MLGSRTLGPQLSNWWAIALDSSLTWSTWIMCWKFAWNITGAMVVDSRLNLEQHCGLLAEFHQNWPRIHSCYMLLSFGDNSDDVTTTEHECGAAIGRRLKISGVMAVVKFPSDNYKKSTSCRCWRKFELNCLYQDKTQKPSVLPRVDFPPTWCPHLSTARNAHVEMQHAQSRSKTETLWESRRANPNFIPSSLYFCRKFWFKPNLFQDLTGPIPGS